MSELKNIADRYERRKSKHTSVTTSSNLFNSYIEAEREAIYEKEIKKRFPLTDKITILEIGAGTGGNIHFIKRIGFKSSNIFANELLKDRIVALKSDHPDITIFEGDATTINTSIKFDIVFQSTVFTSILDTQFKMQLAKKMMSLVKKNGIILWYDFIYDNPANKDVKGIKKSELYKLFETCKTFNFFSVTLAPPIGRRIGRFYNVINKLFPFLRTHIIAVIKC